MWMCNTCGRTFLNAHQWHSCIDLTLEEILGSASERAEALYRLIESAIMRCGEVRIHPQRSRIAFITTMTFAGVRLARAWVDISFIAPAPIDDARIRAVTCYGPTSFAHTVRVAAPEDVDDRLQEWLCIAKRRGDQETLDPNAPVQPASGRVLELLSVPVTTEVVTRAGVASLRPPRYVVELFELQPSVRASIRGTVVEATVETTGRDGWIDCEGALEQLGLVEGDRVDVTLRSAV